MILQQLFADSEAILQDTPTPPMYDNILVQWEVQLTADGKLKGDRTVQGSGFVNLGDKGGRRHLIPYNYGRAVDIVPNLLVDTADYALGVLDKNAVKKHQAFLALVRQCTQSTQDPLVQAVLHFLESGGVPAELLPPDLKTKDRIMFTVNGDEPSAQEDVRDFWRELTEHECKGREKPRGQCLITGENGFVERILPCEVRVDRESAPLISVNEVAGNSYGFEQALNGAVSLRAAEGFTKALNALMRNPATRLSVGDVTYVFWRRSGPDTEATEVLANPNGIPARRDGLDTEATAVPARSDEGSEIVRRLLNTPHRHHFKDMVTRRSADLLPEKFYALALSGNKTRVVFRDWMAMDDWQIKENLKTWLLAQRIASPDGDLTPRYFSVFHLAAALYRERKEVLKADAPALVRTALHGDLIPNRMLAAAIGRCCVERRVTHARAALLKLVRTLHDQEKATLMENPDNMDRFSDNAPYVCGRLLAVLESLQFAALGSVNSNVIDRYFSAAAAEPKRILLGVLLPQAQKAYLAKLRRQKRSSYYDHKIQILLGYLSPAEAGNMPTLKERLSLEEQADFLLGFYHQRAADVAGRKENKEKAERKKADATQDIPEDTQPTLAIDN